MDFESLIQEVYAQHGHRRLDTPDRTSIAKRREEFSTWLEENNRKVAEQAFEEGWADHYVFPLEKRNPYRKEEV